MSAASRAPRAAQVPASMSASTLTLRPDPGAAPLGRMIRAQGGLETRLLLRNGEQLLLALVIPLLVLVVGAYGPIDVELRTLVPGVLALAVLSTSFTSLAISTAYDRRYGVLVRLGSTPLPRAGLLAGKAIGVLAVEALQILVIGGVGLALGWRPRLVGLPLAVLLVLAGTVAFCAYALLMAGTLRAEATLAGSNLVYVLLLVGGAVVVPADRYPAALGAIVEWLPSGALAEGLRAALGGDAAGGPGALAGLGILLLWALVGGLATARLFRWE